VWYNPGRRTLHGQFLQSASLEEIKLTKTKTSGYNTPLIHAERLLPEGAGLALIFYETRNHPG
jgi:hypothetical protein